MILHGIEQGGGPPVCLLHGLFGRAQNLASLARRLSRQFRVVSLDVRNHGSSPHARGMAYEARAQDVLASLAARDALPAYVLGHSMGGKVAMVAALQAPALVPRLVVADIAPVAYQHRNAQVARALLDLPLPPGLDRRQADALLADAVPDAGIRGFLLQNLATGCAPHWRIGLDQIAAGIAEIEGWPDLSGHQAYRGPALFVAGARSDYIRQADHEAITALFPDAVIARLDDAGHWLHADQPEAFGRLVEAFLLA